MAGSQYRPRKMPLEVLIKVLTEEHTTIKEKLLHARDATQKGNFELASTSLKQLDSIFRQHIADEEAQILRLLIDELGRKGAEEEIRVFQQHRPIYRLMTDAAELAARPAQELATKHAELEALLKEHTAAEETRVFPRAASLAES